MNTAAMANSGGQEDPDENIRPFSKRQTKISNPIKNQNQRK